MGSDEGSAESLERPEGDSSPTRGEWTRGNGIAGFDEGSTETLKRPEGFSSPTQGEWTGAHGVTAFSHLYLNALLVLRSKGLKDATCVGWFGDDWDCSVGSPPEAMDHVSSAVSVGYAV